MGSLAATAGSFRSTSLRSRWNRAFTLLTAVVIVTGVVSFLGTRHLVGTFRTSAVQVEREASTSATLRADVVAHAIVVASDANPEQQRQLGRLYLAVSTGFAKAIAEEHSVAAEALLEQSHAEWQTVVDLAGPPEAPADLALRGEAVRVHAPQALALLDQAGASSRAEVRSDLARAARSERRAMVVLGVLELLAIVLAVRLARRLSTEVLQPVGILRRSANHLATGELDHRVVIDRRDELGDLAVSFNAMAEAIAGSQRSLTLEATTDALSGLANRPTFRARLDALLARADQRSGTVAVLFVDLDDFKDVNDTQGHAAGDQLLVVVAKRLVEAVRPQDLVARLGGDEFALLLDGLVDTAQAVTIAERVVAALDEPIRLTDSWAKVGASVGLAIRQDGATVESLIREADVAMYAAKGKGKNRVERYDAGLHEATVARHLLKTELVGVCDRGEMVLEYQPVVDLETGGMVGLEALVRWMHPTRGLLPPSAFIALAEQTGAIVAIGAWVMETATRQLRRWQRRYAMPHLWMSVNVSVRQLDCPGFAADVLDILRATGLPSTDLVLEVTESILADPEGEAAAALSELRLAGVRVALDDFGTGYSSIGYLRQLPVDILKIDRSFVSGSFAGDNGNALLEAIVAMAQRLSLDVIPEGIEDVDQLRRLRTMGCHIGQGFLLSHPLPAVAVDDLLVTRASSLDVALWDAVGLTHLVARD